VSASSADSEVGPVTINTLPNEILLLIFRFDRLGYLDELGYFSRERSMFWKWHRLIHVCRRWRAVVFGSPNFLNLRLVYGPRTRLELTDIWPPLPIAITNYLGTLFPEDYDFDSAIVHHNRRVYDIYLAGLNNLALQRLASGMRVQFPALINLSLRLFDDSGPAPVLPNQFLGGSAPNLESLALYSIPFPALPRLLLSATGLVHLILSHIPHSGYFSPEAMVTGLAVLVNLEFLFIKFESPLSRPDREIPRPPLPTLNVLPALTKFVFSGASEYMEHLVARIDTPLLDSIWITFFHQLIFTIPRLAQFMRRTPRFLALDEAHVDVDDFGVQVSPLPLLGEKPWLRISFRELNWQLSSLAQVFTSFFPSIDTVENLYILRPRKLPLLWQDDIENTQWLEILDPFTAVKNLYVCKEIAPRIAFALQKLVGRRVMDVLPALESLSLEELQLSEPVQEAIVHFVAARRLFGHPLAVLDWE
jgi:hypothetical protein